MRDSCHHLVSCISAVDKDNKEFRRFLVNVAKTRMNLHKNRK